VLEFNTSTYHYKSRRRDQAGIEARIKVNCATRYGYLQSLRLVDDAEGHAPIGRVFETQAPLVRRPPRVGDKKESPVQDCIRVREDSEPVRQFRCLPLPSASQGVLPFGAPHRSLRLLLG